MPDSTLHVIAHIPAMPEHADQVRTTLASLIEPTRKEEGCLRYDLLQNNDDPARFTFIEEWTSDAALDAHLQTPHVLSALNETGRLLADAPEIRRYTLLG